MTADAPRRFGKLSMQIQRPADEFQVEMHGMVGGITAQLHQARERAIAAVLAQVNITPGDVLRQDEADRPKMLVWKLSPSRTRYVLMEARGTWAFHWDEEWHHSGILATPPTRCDADAPRYLSMFGGADAR